ncbi:CHAT domain-containing protein [Streptomyces sp. 5112.2]|uniref:CHAT domain-containing protein n=1 Tax=Streptomyces sp. 5112.2 TaxID=1938848 RepID=UPI0035A35A1D
MAARAASRSARATSSAPGAHAGPLPLPLAGALQLAGFRHVVGILWEVDDVVSARIATSFYT